jgi:hypothetical protein
LQPYQQNHVVVPITQHQSAAGCNYTQQRLCSVVSVLYVF